MTEDAELLRRYALEHSEAAFSELIKRHVDLVYSAALRLVGGDVHRAQDITQQVFSELARHARRLMRHPALVGWLYTTTRRCALCTLRSERRRTARELEATAMNELLSESTPEPDWDRLRPVLEEAMHDLGEKDRHAVLLRYFQNKSLREVGQALDLGENAARMRVDRALEKLRAVLSRRGLAAGSSLASVISANAVQLAPANLTAALATTSFATAGTGTFTLLKIMTATQLKLGLGALLVASVATVLVLQHQAQEQLRAQNDSLTRQLSQAKADNEDLSNRLTAASGSKSFSNDQLNELLKLRGETGLLKSQLSAAKARAQAAASSTPQTSASDPAEQLRQAQIHKMVSAKYLAAAAIFGYANHHGDQFPTSWDQTTGYFDQYERSGLSPGDVVPDTMADFNEMTNLFDLSYQGAMSNLYSAINYHDLIVVREKQPMQMPNGSWVKVYGFADGHSQIEAEPPAGFDAYEQTHTIAPSNQ